MTSIGVSSANLCWSFFTEFSRRNVPANGTSTSNSCPGSTPAGIVTAIMAPDGVFTCSDSPVPMPGGTTTANFCIAVGLTDDARRAADVSAPTEPVSGSAELLSK